MNSRDTVRQGEPETCCEIAGFRRCGPFKDLHTLVRCLSDANTGVF